MAGNSVAKAAKQHTDTPITAEEQATKPSRDDMFDEAHIKLGKARAVIDALAMLEVSGNMDTLTQGSLIACLMLCEELLIETGKMFASAREQPAQAAP